MIIAHLTCNTHSLLACSLTCYSWYIAAVPHLHHTLVTPAYSWCRNSKFTWPKPLRHMHELGLLPLVKKFEVHESRFGDDDIFSPKRFNRDILRQFSALSNVQELGMDRLDIPKFMPMIQRYFGHFLPTVRSLTLREPQGSRHQIIYFIGVFQHLEDLKLLYSWAGFQEDPVDDLTLIPPFVPPLRGRLTMTCFTLVELLTDMIDLFGGIRFRYMDLYYVNGMQLLLDACVETLETLRLYPTDFSGKGSSVDGMRALADGFAASSSLGNTGLSQNKSLQTLEVTASSLLDGGPGFLTYLLSTITSPVFSKVAVFYRDRDFHGVQPTWLLDDYPFRWMSKAEEVEEAKRHHRQFEVLRNMHRVRDFQLVLYADVQECVGRYTVRVLEQAVAAEEAKGGFDGLFSKPSLVYTPRRFSPKFLDDYTAGSPTPWFPL